MIKVITFTNVGEVVTVDGKIFKLATSNEVHVIEEGKQTRHYDMRVCLKNIPIEVDMNGESISLSIKM